MLARAALSLAAITVGVKILGFLQNQIIAYYFGINPSVDAYFVALSVPLAFFFIVRELIEAPVLPGFVASLESERTEQGWRVVTAVGAGIAVATSLAALLVWTHASAAIAWIAPGIEAASAELAARLAQVMIPVAVLMSLSSLTQIVLNGYRRFALPAAGDLVFKAAPCVLALLLVSQIGIFALAVGAVVGALGRIAVHGIGLRRELRLIAWPNRSDRDELRLVGALMLPLALGVLFAQLSELADNYFSSMVGAGAIAARTFARKIIDVPILLVPYALSVVVFPYFVSLANRGEISQLFAALAETVRGLALTFGFLSVVSFFLAEPIVTLLLERGAFDAEARVATALPLRIYAMGLVTFSIEAILVPFYFAMRDTLTPVVVGIGGVVINVALCALLIGPMGVGGVALALVLSKTLKLILLAGLLGRKGQPVPLGALLVSVLRIAAAAGAAGITLWGFAAWLPYPGPASSSVWQLGYLAASSATALLAFVAVVGSMPSPERDWLFSFPQLALRTLRSFESRGTAR